MAKLSFSREDSESTAIYSHAMKAEYTDRCVFCQKKIKLGEQIFWHRKWKKAVCQVCRWAEGKDDYATNVAGNAARKLLGG